MQLQTIIERHGWTAVSARAGDTAPDRLLLVGEAPGSTLMIVDPKGGIAGGQDAADILVREARDKLRTPCPDVGELSILLSGWDQLVESSAEGGEASLALATITPRRVLAASVGDAEVWIRTPRDTLRLSGRRKFGTGYEIGTGCLLFESSMLPASQVAWVAVMSDGCAHHITDEALESILDHRLSPQAILDRMTSEHGPFMLDSFSLALHRPAGSPGEPVRI